MKVKARHLHGDVKIYAVQCQFLMSYSVHNLISFTLNLAFPPAGLTLLASSAIYYLHKSIIESTSNNEIATLNTL